MRVNGQTDAVGVQEQTEDILVPPLLRNCLTFNYISLYILPPQISGPCNSFYCLGHSENVYDDDNNDDNDDGLLDRHTCTLVTHTH